MQIEWKRFLGSEGYQQILESSYAVFVKRQEMELLVVSIATETVLALKSWQQVTQEKEEITNQLVKQGADPMHLHHLLLVEVAGEVSEHFKELASKVEGVWFISQYPPAVFVFERQTTKFYGLYEAHMNFLDENPQLPKKGVDVRWFLSRLTPVTLILVLINVFVYFISSHFGNVYDAQDMYRMGAMTFDAVFIRKEFWRLFTAMFLHYGISHLANNMVSLLCLGTMLERRIGSLRFAILYLVSGLLAGFSSMAVDYYQIVRLQEASYAVSAGASGAIFGVIGGLIAIVLMQHFWKDRNQTEEISMRSLLLMTFFTLWEGFASVGVDNAAHVGGLIFGFLLSFLLARKRHMV